MACYSEEKGIQEFYNSMIDHAQNMAIYSDAYQIVETFLWDTSAYIHEHMIKDGLSPKVHTIDDFIAEAKKHEAAKKILDYYNRMIQQLNHRKTLQHHARCLSPTSERSVLPLYEGHT
jgi:hypothetical protein